ncbi:TrfB-related DNA-binding protein [Pseudoalteromonas luteoviolacea]|uniref:TrfB-related DNA-binding protein n=1 Tax=Pseudoalteromonas luteoviolacea TaxID=43657 RepID=UPI001B3809AA|nr:TrfB-related DNA-binding protein [Pseudoalteromonas luteoviolacea]MBQ4839809.1 hypothetical protein [Pseudoalteromonas luteoviolacea]
MTKEMFCILSMQGKQVEPRTLEILEKVLVDGFSQPAIAKEYDVSQQFISGAVSRFYSRLTEQMRHIPDELVIRNVAVHPDLLDELKALQIKSYKMLNNK